VAGSEITPPKPSIPIRIFALLIFVTVLRALSLRLLSRNAADLRRYSGEGRFGFRPGLLFGVNEDRVQSNESQDRADKAPENQEGLPDCLFRSFRRGK
jgi:hypothetical protein